MDNSSLKQLLLQYSLDDLLKSFAALDLWIPNIASPVKMQYLYVLLEIIQNDLPLKSKIISYREFECLCANIIKLLPTFSILEDYVPERDWGEIRYYYDKSLYKIFYGCDLSNSYDHYYSFEIIHKQFENAYLKMVNRSVKSEFRFCLSVQDHLLSNIKQIQQASINISPGNISVPSEVFWQEVKSYIDQFTPCNNFDKDIVALYSCDFDTKEAPKQPDLKKFEEFAFKGKNCTYYFVKKNEKYYPVMPRRYFSILYDTWGNILKQVYRQLIDDGKNPEISIGIEVFKFIQDRVKKSNLYGVVSPVSPEKSPYHTTFAAAIVSKNKLFMVNVIPPSVQSTVVDNYLDELKSELIEAQKVLSVFPTKLMLWMQKQIVEIYSNTQGEVLTPVFLIVIPYCMTELFSFKRHRNLPGHIIGIDQFVGIIDGLENIDDLAEFFDYYESAKCTIAPMASYLDIYGSFKDLNGVLSPGARKYDWISIGCHLGSDFRYRDLQNFWQKFPEQNFFGNPRSWAFPEETSRVLSSRAFLGYAYYQKVGCASLFINSPAHLMKYEQGKITDLIMNSIYDALVHYADTLVNLSFAKEICKIQILVLPLSLVRESAELHHVTHLLPNDKIWEMDISGIDYCDYGIRIVFNDESIIASQSNFNDRTIQINLLLDILRQIDNIYKDANFPQLEDLISKEKTKKCRVKLFAIQKRVSFPELIKPILPEKKDWKLADKTIAQVASSIKIVPGAYNQVEAKKRLLPNP